MDKTMNILITGGAGYIGIHTVYEFLEKSQHNIIVIDNFSNSYDSSINELKNKHKNLWVYNRDCRDDLSDIFENHKLDSVIHFAASKSVPESIKLPVKYWDNNVNSLLSILKNCEKYDVKNIIFSSSCSLYGNVEKLPINENTPLSDTQSPYATTKLVGEKILEDFSKANKRFKIISLRYFNPVGCHYSGLIGENSKSDEHGIMSIICESALNKTDLIIFGNDYDTPDGTCIRDYVHVSDIARAHRLALSYSIVNMKESYDVFNLGSECGHSTLELIKAFEKQNSVKVNYKFGNKRSGDIVKIYSDSSKAKRLLDWESEYNIYDMVSSSWYWFKKIKNI